MSKEQSNNELNDYIKNNIKEIIDYLIKLNCNQENVQIDYTLKKRWKSL